MQNFSSMNVLVVEDSNVIRKVLIAFLGELGFSNIDSSDSGTDAFAKFRAKRYDLIISDWDMAPMSGLDLLKAVRQEVRGFGLPFIMATARSRPQDVAAAGAAGATAHIGKPFDVKTLKEKIDQCLCVST